MTAGRVIGLVMVALGALASCKGQIVGDPRADQSASPTSLPKLGPDGRYVCDDRTYGGKSLVRRLTTREYENAISDLFGLEGSDKYPAAYGTSVTGYSTEPNLNGIGQQGVEQLLEAAEEVAEALAPQLATLLPCAAEDSAADECANEFLDTIGRRAFRRPLRDDERATLLELYSAERADEATFAEAVSVMTSALLQMPGFLYLLEAPAATNEDRALEGYELATRLSLFLWNSLPDDALLDKAAEGALSSPEGLLEEAGRLFDDPRAARSFARFFREWTGTTELYAADKDEAAFSYLDDALAASINESFDRFADEQARTGSVYSLLRSNSAWVDQRLSSFFGLPEVSEFTRVDLDAGVYSGIMTQPGMMAALAHASETSYVFRGRFVWKRLLCNELGTPPGNAMSEFAALEKPEDPTAKDLSEAVRAKVACAGCHGVIDPPGLAFEHFDALGAYRDEYASGKAIETGGALAIDDPPLEFTGPADLLESLATRPEVGQCLAKQLFRFVAARGEEGPDLCAVQRISDALSASAGDLRSAFLAAVQTDSFRYRRGE